MADQFWSTRAFASVQSSSNRAWPTATRLADGLASAGIATPDLIESAGDRYLVYWPMAVEVVPDKGEPWVGSMQATVLLEGSDVDHLIASLRAAGWSPA
jgi:hypothetical protein